MDWIVQFDPPDDASEYIHRVGRTARGAHGKGRALLFLMPQELGFLKHLRAGRVPLAEYAFPAAKVANVQSQLERLVSKNYYLHAAAKEAYRGYVLAYNSHALKDAFDVHTLDLAAIAKSLGMGAPPRVSLGLESKTANVRAAARRSAGGVGNGGSHGREGAAIGGGPNSHNKRMRTGHAFSADNPYGRREAGDKRQVVRG